MPVHRFMILATYGFTGNVNDYGPQIQTNTSFRQIWNVSYDGSPEDYYKQFIEAEIQSIHMAMENFKPRLQARGFTPYFDEVKRVYCLGNICGQWNQFTIVKDFGDTP